jgi:hypothetical protein
MSSQFNTFTSASEFARGVAKRNAATNTHLKTLGDGSVVPSMPMFDYNDKVPVTGLDGKPAGFVTKL